MLKGYVAKHSQDPITTQSDFDWRSAIVDLRKMSDEQFRQCWLAIVLDASITDDEVSPKVIGMMLAVVRERYAQQLGVDHRIWVCRGCNASVPAGQSGKTEFCAACRAKL